jgi:ribosome assembly protein YihI (activator of Der GTPase)
MGLLTGLLTLPLAPVRGVAWVAEKVAEQAELELYDENRIMAELAELERAKNAGELDEDQFNRYVDELLERLELGRQIQLERGRNVG